MLRINLDKLLSFSSLVDSCLMVSVLEVIDKPYLGIVFLNILASTKPCVVDNLFSNPNKALLFVFWAEFFLAMDFWHKKTLGWKPGHPIFMWCMSRFCFTMSFFGLFSFWCMWPMLCGGYINLWISEKGMGMNSFFEMKPTRCKEEGLFLIEIASPGSPDLCSSYIVLVGLEQKSLVLPIVARDFYSRDM